jgi:hypothetical protein
MKHVAVFVQCLYVLRILYQEVHLLENTSILETGTV